MISQRRGLKLVETKEIEYIAPTKFNFVRYGYPFYQSWDNTSKRFSENSKIIVVEGNVCTGKGHVAQKLAEAFGMYYFSDCTDDDIYTFKLPQGDFDLRSHNHALPDFAKYYTTSMFWNDKDPIKNGKPLYLQIQYFARRYFSYTKAKCMLFNTGQGSVLERSPFSDFVFAQALNHCGLLSDYALDWFMYNHASTVRSIWRPHVVVYLRTPLSMIREEIKKRNVPWQTNAHNLTDKFITSYTSLLEKNYLEPISKISQVFVIDRSTTEIYDEEDMRIQMERLTDFELDGKGLLKDDIKFLEWRDNTHRETPSKRARWFRSVIKNFRKRVYLSGVYGTKL
ncbi:unnamed protein product [Protopolystoma xenopodis]|uniref:Deoxynucleoside kinase domain-containing protein n=1 Tax=Protopolystoma xenopodis TaxID=117903 RepID=A0A448XSF5_9PLAT|nr:unnamed protein product [Protopolystoma xenopodis]